MEPITATLTTDQPATTALPLPSGHTVGTLNLTATDPATGDPLGNGSVPIDATYDPNTRIYTLPPQTVALGDGLIAFVDASVAAFRLGVSQCPGPVQVDASMVDYTNTAIPPTGGGSGTPGGRHH